MSLVILKCETGLRPSARLTSVLEHCTFSGPPVRATLRQRFCYCRETAWQLLQVVLQYPSTGLPGLRPSFGHVGVADGVLLSRLPLLLQWSLRLSCEDRGKGGGRSPPHWDPPANPPSGMLPDCVLPSRLQVLLHWVTEVEL
jgi:hypothetical protein